MPGLPDIPGEQSAVNKTGYVEFILFSIRIIDVIALGKIVGIDVTISSSKESFVFASL